MKRTIFILKLLVILTACLAIGGIASYVFVAAKMPAEVYTLNQRVSGQQLNVEFDILENNRFVYKLYYQTGSQIRALVVGEYKVEDGVLSIKKDGSSQFEEFGRINKYHIVTEYINFDGVGLSFAGDFSFNCQETISARRQCLLILFLGVGLTVAGLAAILTLGFIRKKRSRPTFKEGNKKEQENKAGE